MPNRRIHDPPSQCQAPTETARREWTDVAAIVRGYVRAGEPLPLPIAERHARAALRLGELEGSKLEVTAARAELALIAARSRAASRTTSAIVRVRSARTAPRAPRQARRQRRAAAATSPPSESDDGPSAPRLADAANVATIILAPELGSDATGRRYSCGE